MRGIVWFREDLRTVDNTALFQAAKICDEGIIATYILDEQMWLDHKTAACKAEFILRGLNTLQKHLHALHIPFIVLIRNPHQTIAEQLYAVIEQTQAKGLFYNHQYEINESRRDQAVEQFCQKNGISVHGFHDQVIIAPGQIKNLQGNDYSVFTPYKRAWYHTFSNTTHKILPQPKKQTPLSFTHQSALPDQLTHFTSSIDPTQWPAGQEAAKKRLSQFLTLHLSTYHHDRDYPALDHTSHLSPYLATGMISPRQCFLGALEVNQGELDTGNKGAVTWMSELIWREFYKHLLAALPRLSMHKPYQLETEQLSWNDNPKLLEAWKEGQTGYPLIDAAMRQLKTIGWMHNRLRMVVAMFLTKNCFIDWRLGEAYFMSQLIDGDLAANNGGWQWSASTGTDAAPYFRIFNPLLQSERFDPQGTFIKQYCPELAAFDAKGIHEPYKSAPLIAQLAGYPRPIIERNAYRDKVLSAYKALKKK